MVRVKTKKTEENIQKTFFGPLDKASMETLWDSVEPTWCEASETRLLSKIIEHKPAGICKHFHLMALTNYMNNVYEDEHVDFEELLSPDDLERLYKKKKSGDTSVMVFKPKYRIRPTANQIMSKVHELWDMKVVEENEGIPERMQRYDEFFLPAGEYSELLKKKEEGVPRKKARRGGSPDSFSSRCSTPANKN